jgi:hypothetical protein
MFLTALMPNCAVGVAHRQITRARDIRGNKAPIAESLCSCPSAKRELAPWLAQELFRALSTGYTQACMKYFALPLEDSGLQKTFC